MKILITLCARGGSKGIPGKNIRQIAGKPLISYSIKHAKEFSKIYESDIALSTESNEIRNIAEVFELYTKYSRPEVLATDTAGKIDTILHLLEYEEKSREIRYDYVLDLDISSPFRCLDDLLNAFDQILLDKNALNIFSVNKANRNPYFNMVKKGEDNQVNLVIQQGEKYSRRQDTPEIFDLTTVCYVGKPSIILNKNSIFEGKVAGVEIPRERAIDIDTELDFQIAEFLFKSKANQ